MKKRNIMLGSAIILVVLLVAGGTLAWFTAEAKPVVNTFTAGKLEIELVDEFEDVINVNPGDCYDKVVYVKNTGSKRAMVRVHESTLIEGFTPSNENQNPNMDIVEFKVNENWEYDNDTNYFYYKNVLHPGGKTEPILSSKICFNGSLMGNEYQGATFSINLEADAIQATNGAPTYEGWKFDPLKAETTSDSE